MRKWLTGFLVLLLLTGCSGKSTGKDCVIKGNINSKGERIYHMPRQRFYGATNPERWFCTEEDARKAGFRKAKV